MKKLNEEHGILSDSFVHFTPEYYSSQNWRVKGTDAQPNTVELLYFISDQKTLERELIHLGDTHARIINVIDHCLDSTFSRDHDWKSIAAKLVRDGGKFGELFAQALGEQKGRA